MYVFQTLRLGFRAWLNSDTAPFVAMNQNTQVMEFFPSLLSQDDTLAMIARIRAHFEEHGFGLWAVDDLSTGVFIGFIGLTHPRFESFFTPCVEIGWRLHPDAWGKGYATEGARACLEYAFGHLKLSEVYSMTALPNKRSENVMLKIGMAKIGEFEHPLVPENHFLHPHVLYKIENASRSTGN